jgi:fatty-acyl-CoA synthase
MPNITNALLRHARFAPARVRTLRRGLTLGSAFDIRTAAEGLGVTHICNIYGSTETYGNCCVTPWDWPLERKLLCQGPPLPGVELRVVDPETGQAAAAGSEGELLVRGYISPGYADAPEGANEVFGQDGWYRTGDIGTLDADGCFRFGARATEMIKTTGINVAPSEVEEFLRLHDGVLDVAVVGVPDPETGQAVIAFVVPAHGASVTEDDVLEHSRGMARYKHPARVHIVDRLPKTATGKLSRRVLVELDAKAVASEAR